MCWPCPVQPRDLTTYHNNSHYSIGDLMLICCTLVDFLQLVTLSSCMFHMCIKFNINSTLGQHVVMTLDRSQSGEPRHQAGMVGGGLDLGSLCNGLGNMHKLKTMLVHRQKTSNMYPHIWHDALKPNMSCCQPCAVSYLPCFAPKASKHPPANAVAMQLLLLLPSRCLAEISAMLCHHTGQQAPRWQWRLTPTCGGASPL